jgi:hypothetical protein
VAVVSRCLVSLLRGGPRLQAATAKIASVATEWLWFTTTGKVTTYCPARQLWTACADTHNDHELRLP